MNYQQLMDRFVQVAENPAKQMQSYLEQGKKVVLTAPVYTPEEIIHAMGAVPVGAWGADVALERAKEYFPAFICSIMQSILEMGIAGTYKGASAIVIPSLCDSLKCLGQNWKYAVKDIPFIPMTYPQNRANENGIQFAIAGYKRVIRDLESALDTEFDPKALAQSNAVYNRHNAAMREIDALLADHPEVSARQRSAIYKSAGFMAKEEHTELVENLIEVLKEQESGKEKIRIVTSGILCDSPALLDCFDELGFQIVADDVAAESRQYRTDVPEGEDPLRALAEKFSRMDHCSVLYDVEKKRADLIVKLAQDRKAHGVLIVMTKFCDPEEFDFVPIRKTCRAAGVSISQIEIDRQMADFAQVRTLLETLRDTIA